MQPEYVGRDTLDRGVQAGGTVWAVMMVAGEALRLPGADLARLRDALAMAEARMAKAGGASMQ